MTQAGRLLSLNVGGPREIEWEGKTVRTAIWKEAVDGPRMVRRINIDGDDQADRLAHGGEHRAVFVYQIASYRYWERQLGRDDFSYGQFGENFTVEGLPDDEVCIGDRYRIGEALFEVTQPRVTCYRVGIRMQEPAMPTMLVAHHRPGFYLRVLEEGAVEAGEAIVKVLDGPERLTVSQVDGLLYLPGRSKALLERALRVPALSEGWRGSFRDLLAKAEGAGAAAPAWAGFRPLRVTEIRRESTTIASFRLSDPGGDALPDAIAGQYLTFRLRPEAGGPPLVRSYSMSDVADGRSYRVSVKREGPGSRYMHEHVSVGDVLDVAAPRGEFCLREDGRPVVLVSAGVGATPVLAMLHALAAAASTRPVWWLHGARNREEHAFGPEVDALLAALPEAHRFVAYSRPSAPVADGGGAAPAPAADGGGAAPAGAGGGGAAPAGADHDATGRLGPDTLAAAGLPEDADYYVCGPDAFMRAIGAALTARGVAPERVATEAFGAVAVHASGIVKADRPPHVPTGPPGAGPQVTFSRSGLSVPWDERYPSLLDFAEACDVPVGFGCRHGVCHNCESGVLAGDVTWVTEPLEPPPEGRILACCTQPGSEITLDL